ncbi:putative baseplate assembly protein [Spirulina major CS-329]|uniref:putative baseplate assembly protein n=1 Tax=Spirulina TaxID=1154 RepID=UPI00232D3352|nr:MULTISPECIES: putative baseplate assembly protein [Spirulina]MDB9494073.1 putative baseplate assembly protein [Spirulina subsalsa CS-330]MDB9504901.1 putative baseplate assembly protein [Spirulina major CS-329]
MEFDFLPQLPKSNLDDRKFEDLVEECLLRIPRYCPEWTNFNPSDPGVTMIELFAWLSDQMLMRFNRVPERNYITFLELLGIRLQAPRPAQTHVTFYLSTSLPEPYTIAAGVETATNRTEAEEAIVFSTDHPLTIGVPRIRHLLTADSVEERPQILRDRFSGTWTMLPSGDWEGRDLELFNEQPREGNCFYLVFDPQQEISGNVVAVNFRGEAATATGINPEHPPRSWEAWTGTHWQPVLLRPQDDHTEGFSFSEVTRNGGNPLQGEDVIFHCPRQWPVETFGTYNGRWLRCTYRKVTVDQPGYLNSPRIVGMGCRALGGTVSATQSIAIANEILGESDGMPGQRFRLQGAPILPRSEGEYLRVTPPGGLPQRWQEVEDFADSGADDLHYTLDSRTGELQLGPLIRESAQLLDQMDQWRQPQLATTAAPDPTALTRNKGERQYGAVPPRGAMLTMVSYRTGGGQQGNVQRDTIRIVKSAVPYVAQVTNHEPARHGSDGETLEGAVLRVPKLLRTRDRAVTTEDFETLALQGGQGAIARARCLPTVNKEQAGTVELVLVPQLAIQRITAGYGTSPAELSLTPALIESTLAYLDDRRLLGVEIRCREPDYVGVSVHIEVALEPEYREPLAQQHIRTSLESQLYRFLNPVIGGLEGQGWEFGRPVYASDIINLFQAQLGVRYLGTIQLFRLTRTADGWERTLAQESHVAPGALGLICSWRDEVLRSSHVISVI